MEALYQRRCAQYIYVVPEGLREIMSDISREVLREQPLDICLFITNYLEALMITRENARVAAKAVAHTAEISEVVAELLQRTNMSKEQANKTVEVIQKAFRQHMKSKANRHEAMDKETLLEMIINKTGVSHETVESAVCVIQRAYRMFRQRRLKDMSDVVDWKKAFVKTMDIYRKSNVTQEEANRAATLIKAAYKGYYTRRVIREFCREADATFEALVDEEKEVFIHSNPSLDIKDSVFVEHSHQIKETPSEVDTQYNFGKYFTTESIDYDEYDKQNLKPRIYKYESSHISWQTEDLNKEFEHIEEIPGEFDVHYDIQTQRFITSAENDEFDKQYEPITSCPLDMVLSTTASTSQLSALVVEDTTDASNFEQFTEEDAPHSTDVIQPTLETTQPSVHYIVGEDTHIAECYKIEEESEVGEM